MSSLMDIKMRGVNAYAVDDTGVYYNYHDRAIVFDANEEWAGYSFTDGLGDQIWAFLTNAHATNVIDAWLASLPRAHWVIDKGDVIAVEDSGLQLLDAALKAPQVPPSIAVKKCNNVYVDSQPLSSMQGKLTGLNEIERKLRHEISMAPSKFDKRATTSWPRCTVDGYVEWKIEAVSEISTRGDYAKITFGCPKCYPKEFI